MSPNVKLTAGAAVGIAAILGLAYLASKPASAASALPSSSPSPNAHGDFYLVPGNMGTLNVNSGPNAQTISLVVPQLGKFASIDSTNQSVVPNPDYLNGTNGGTISAVFPGTTVLTIQWTDSTGQAQTTTLTIVAS